MSPEIQARFVRERLFLQGIAENDLEADRADERAPTAQSMGKRINWGYPIVDMLRIRPHKGHAKALANRKFHRE